MMALIGFPLCCVNCRSHSRGKQSGQVPRVLPWRMNSFCVLHKVVQDEEVILQVGLMVQLLKVSQVVEITYVSQTEFNGSL